MQELYLIRVTDAAYAHNGSSEYLITDKAMFEAFDKCSNGRMADVEVPEEFEDDGASEWLYSADLAGEVSYPFIMLGMTEVWSNC
jgi:hypothetical protein